MITKFNPVYKCFLVYRENDDEKVIVGTIRDDEFLISRSLEQIRFTLDEVNEIAWTMKNFYKKQKCDFCDSEFLPKKKTRKYCSDNCRVKAWQRKKTT